MVRYFHQKTKPDVLTRQWEIYPKEGDMAYGEVNPHNFHPIFTSGSEQFLSSLCTTLLEEVIL
jgi:hypothetical protein